MAPGENPVFFYVFCTFLYFFYLFLYKKLHSIVECTIFDYINMIQNNIKTNIMANQNFKVGDIFYSSWGYNTTRVTFYQVVQVIGKCTAILSEVESISTPSDLNEYWINKTPSKNNFIGETIRKRFSKNCFKIDHSMYAFKWDGKPLSASSNYARFNN